MSKDAERGRYRTPGGSKLWQYLSVIINSCLSGSIGSIIGWNSPSIVKLLAPDSPIKATPSDVSSMVAAMNVGHIIGPPLNIFLADKIGRKYTMIFASFPLAFSWGLITIASTVWEIFVARFLAGIAIGLFACIGPMYMGEVLAPSLRGIGGAFSGFTFNSGVLVTFIVAPYLSISLTAGICLAVSIFLTLAFWFMPESPYFLVMRNRTDEAEEVLEKLRGKNDVSEELETIVNSLANKGVEITKTGSIKDVFCVRANLRAFIIVLLFATTHHLGGFYAILVYGRLLFKSASDTVSDYTVNVLVGVMQLGSALGIMFIIERVGRRTLVLSCGLIAMSCNFVIGFFFLAKDYMAVDVSAYSLAPLVASLVMIPAFNAGFVCVQIVVMSEIFAAEVKAVSTCLVSICSGLIGTAATKLYIWVAITMDFGHGPPFVVFAVYLLIAVVLIYVLSPETKGKTLIEIQRELNSRT